jgi:formate dehydrogenase major subunit
MLRYGIPRFRLPETVLDEDISRVASLGVTFKQEVKLGSGVKLDELARQFDAVIVAAGCQLPQDLGVPGANATGVVSGLEFMDKINTRAIKRVEGAVLVLGGGFTAMDCARSSWRLGAKSVTVVYRRSRNELRVDDRELAETSGEGIGFEYLLSPVAVITGSDGRVTGLKLQRNTLGEPGPDGRRSITPVTGAHGQIELRADMIIAATGQSADRSLTGGMRPDPAKPVGMDNVFATGDYVTGASSIIKSIGVAHKTARVVDQFLMGRDRFEERTMGREEWPRLNISGGSYQGWKAGCGNGFDLVPRLDNPSVPLDKRRAQSVEADLGYNQPQTFQQGQRCYLCDHNIQIDGDTCILCYNCVDVCPYNCIHMRAEENVRVARDGKYLGEGQAHTYMIIDETNCVRCGLCLDVCPDDCITMERREIATVFKA